MTDLLPRAFPAIRQECAKARKVAPSKAETALLEPFVGLALENIHVPTTKGEFASATAEIKASGVVGFDTESKPTFVTGDDQFGLAAFIDAMDGKNILGEIDPYGDNAHVLPLRLIDENDSFHLGSFDAVCGNFAAPSGRGSPFHSLGRFHGCLCLYSSTGSSVKFDHECTTSSNISP